MVSLAAGDRDLVLLSFQLKTISKVVLKSVGELFTILSTLSFDNGDDTYY